MAMSDNTLKVIKHLKGLNGAEVTANELAEQLGLTSRQVNGIFTGGIQRKGLGFREPKEIILEDGTPKEVKLLKLTQKGFSFENEDN